jgi:uncharacterized protein YdeI (YjbR/CyaY-like superfamily)
MPTHIPEVDAYIDKAAPFAQPILEKLRKLFHIAHPEMQEVMKWSFPHFEYKGPVGSMAGFKQHCSFGFWKGKLLKDPHKLFEGVGETTMCAVKVSSLKDMPSDKIILAYIQEAIALNEEGIKAPRPTKAKGDLVIPAYFMAALKKNKEALAIFEAFSTSHKREYVEWVTEAKQDATRDKRLAQAIEWMAAGKSRHWKYQK